MGDWAIGRWDEECSESDSPKAIRTPLNLIGIKLANETRSQATDPTETNKQIDQSINNKPQQMQQNKNKMKVVLNQSN